MLRPRLLPAALPAAFLVCSQVTPPRAEAQALSSTVQVAMPDGVTLATDVWRPLLDSSPRPVLLRRTPYGRAVDFNLAQALVGAGYVLVSQDVRGRGNSQGVFVPFFDDKTDGKATIEWAAKQPWSNGAVATYSNSAEGIVQYMGMAGDPEGLRCAHVGMPTHDVYEGLLPGGVWRSELGTSWLTGLGAASVVDVWKSHEVRDTYWDQATLTTAEMATIDHPVFIVGGLFDIFAPSEVRALRELQAHAAPAVRSDVFLILGPWTHGGIGLRGQGQLLFPEDAPYTKWADELLAYVKWCTGGGPRPALAAVRYYLTAVGDETAVDPTDNVTRIVTTGEWREADSWPPAGIATQRLYAHPDGLRGALAVEAEPAVAPVDPSAPLPSLGGGNLTTPPGPYDQAELDARADVIVLESEPVTVTTDVVGSPRVKLWVSSDTTDLDVIVRLEVLTPKGKAVALTDGALRGRFAAGTDALVPLTPGEPLPFDILLGPVAARLAPGYALRIAVSGTLSPRYEPGPNVATALSEKPTPVATKLTLHRDAEHPSEVLIPVLAGALPGAQEIAPEEVDGGAPAVDAGTTPPTGDAAAPPAGSSGSSSDAGGTSAPSPSDGGAAGPRTDDGGGCACSTRAGSGNSFDAGALSLLALGAWLRRRRYSQPTRSASSARSSK